jgi:alanyl-tRNA synthetase
VGQCRAGAGSIHVCLGKGGSPAECVSPSTPLTERLYYTDPYLTEFSARVVDVVQVDGRPGVILDRSAFYPTSGGQPFDTGTLGQARVTDVIDRDDGTIVHVVEGQPPAGEIAAAVDWARRFDHMQQHTGQHVLSAAFDRGCGARTVSFHLGAASATIDLAREVTAVEIAQAEDAANRVVWEDRPVTIRFVEAQDAAALPLRKESARSGTLRIIDVEGFDVSACGGTHVARTGAIGIIVVSGWERFRGGSRIEFRCGTRALQAHRSLRDTVAASMKLTSVAQDELPQGIERLQADNKELRRQVKDLAGRLALYEADAMAARAIDANGLRAVIEAVPDLDMNGLKTIAQSIAARPGYVAVLFSTARPVSVVIARSADLALDAAGALKQLTARFGGKGGGRPELAQGGGLAATPEELKNAAIAAVSQQAGGFRL